MRWVLQNPIVFYTLMALGWGSCLDLFVTLKHEIGGGRKRQAALEVAIGQLSAEIGELRERVLESEARADVLVAPTPPRSGVNLSTRSQALRMFHRGAANQQIAAALGIPEKEVELLLKVQRMALDAPLTAENVAAPAEMERPPGGEAASAAASGGQPT
jgi:hypothetical protein